MQVFGGGTGGTITGVGRKFREVSPETILVGYDPEGSKFAFPESLNSHSNTFWEIEGICIFKLESVIICLFINVCYFCLSKFPDFDRIFPAWI